MNEWSNWHSKQQMKKHDLMDWSQPEGNGAEWKWNATEHNGMIRNGTERSGME